MQPVVPAEVTAYDSDAPPRAVADADGVNGDDGTVTAVVGDQVTVCAARVIVKDTSRVPAAYALVAAALARTVQVPTAEYVTTPELALTVQPVVPAEDTEYEIDAPPRAVASADGVRGDAGTVTAVVGNQVTDCALSA